MGGGGGTGNGFRLEKLWYFHKWMYNLQGFVFCFFSFEVFSHLKRLGYVVRRFQPR